MDETANPYDGPRPFLKAVGGKRRLLPVLAAKAPARINRYYEPFVGGGAFFFKLARERRFATAMLSDKSARLMHAYRAVRDEPESVIAAFALHAAAHSPEHFRRVRAAPPTSFAELAAWFIYINRAGYNGLYRENKRRQCNTPFGDGKPVALDAMNVRACSRALADASLLACDFDSIFISEDCDPAPGDFVFFDAPYDGQFSGYTAEKFGEVDQERLAERAEILKRDGVAVLVTNADTPLIRKLYRPGFWSVDRVEVRGDSVNCDPKKRARVPELVIS